MDILDSKDRDKSIFHLERQPTLDNVKIKLLGDRKSHLCLPDNLIKISPKFRQTKTFYNKMSENNMTYYQDDDVPHPDRARDRDPHIGQRQLGNSPHLLRRKTTDKGKLKATLPDIKTQDDNNRKLTMKDYNRPDVIVAKKVDRT